MYEHVIGIMAWTEHDSYNHWFHRNCEADAMIVPSTIYIIVVWTNLSLLTWFPWLSLLKAVVIGSGLLGAMPSPKLQIYPNTRVSFEENRF